MQIPVLLYHSNNVSGNDYETNDHVALREDLETISALGFEVASLHDIARWARGANLFDDTPRVGLSFDDGSAFDFYDLWRDCRLILCRRVSGRGTVTSRLTTDPI